MNEIIIEDADDDSNELLRYNASIAPLVGQKIQIKNKGHDCYHPYLVLSVEHAIYHGDLMVVCSVEASI